jgi:hypothetical protein
MGKTISASYEAFYFVGSVFEKLIPNSLRFFGARNFITEMSKSPSLVFITIT